MRSSDVALSAASSTTRFSDSARFERWSHFKDYGIPGTLTDALNQAAIADGTCRLVEPPIELDGDAFWYEPDRVKAVLAALAAAPPTGGPSYFVRAASNLLTIPCSTPAPRRPANFTVHDRGAALQNWWHALCAPESDPSWGGKFDPAEQPQQAALSTGFACIVACDANSGYLDVDAMAGLSVSPQGSRDKFCGALPWSVAVDFSKAATETQLATMAAVWLSEPCHCNKTEGN